MEINMPSPLRICLFFTLFALLLLASASSSYAVEATRSCAVKEVVKGGMYVYFRCLEKDKDIWLATVARDFKTDEIVYFIDAPPMIDFYSKHLDRTFSEVIFTDLLPPEAKKK